MFQFLNAGSKYVVWPQGLRGQGQFGQNWCCNSDARAIAAWANT